MTKQAPGTRFPSAIFTAGKYNRNLSLNSSLHSRAVLILLFIPIVAPPLLSYFHLTSCDNLVGGYICKDKRIHRDWRDFRDMGDPRATARERRFERRTMNCPTAKICLRGSQRENCNARPPSAPRAWNTPTQWRSIQLDRTISRARVYILVRVWAHRARKCSL